MKFSWQTSPHSWIICFIQNHSSLKTPNHHCIRWLESCVRRSKVKLISWRLKLFSWQRHSGRTHSYLRSTAAYLRLIQISDYFWLTGSKVRERERLLQKWERCWIRTMQPWGNLWLKQIKVREFIINFAFQGYFNQELWPQFLKFDYMFCDFTCYAHYYYCLWNAIT